MRGVAYLYYYFLKNSIYKKYREIKRYEKEGIEKSLFQKQKLSELLLYSSRNIPYYFNKINLNELEDPKKVLSRIQPITKVDLSANFDLLTSTNNNFTKNAIVNFSGGSTGIPTKVLQDKNFITSASAWKLYSDSFIANPPAKIIRLWGDSNISKKRKSLIEKFKLWILGIESIDAFNLNQKTYNQFVKKINRFKPDIVEAYVDALYNLLNHNYNEIEKLKHTSFEIITSAGTLYPHMQDLFKQKLNKIAFNRYGSREVGPIAMSCNYGKLHVNEYNLYVEVLNKNNEKCKTGETGFIHVTTLDNYAMPLIRFNLGDLGSFDDEKKCKCGRKGQILKSIDGRSSSQIITSSGKVISGLFFVHFFGVIHNNGSIKNFQIVQENIDSIKIKVVLINDFEFQAIKKDIELSITTISENELKVEWEIVEDISPLKSGKYQYVINNLL